MKTLVYYDQPLLSNESKKISTFSYVIAVYVNYDAIIGNKQTLVLSIFEIR